MSYFDYEDFKIKKDFKIHDELEEGLFVASYKEYSNETNWEEIHDIVNLELLDDDKILKLIDKVDFEVKKVINKDNKKVYKLKDLQGGNLANIESEEFENLLDIVDRLSVYFYDYFIRFDNTIYPNNYKKEKC